MQTNKQKNTRVLFTCIDEQRNEKKLLENDNFASSSSLASTNKLVEKKTEWPDN